MLRMGGTQHRPFVLVIALFLSHVAGSITPTGISPEVNALITMKFDLSDPAGALASWDKHAIDPCRFIHVTCSNQSYVVGIELSNARLNGTLSPAIGSLPNLQHLAMSNNFLHGILPAELGNLSNLVTLDLSNNRFDGTIPSTMQKLRNLVSLRLNSNLLSGGVPAFLSNMSRLQSVDLSVNNLSPPVPPLSASYFNITANPLICGSEPVRGCPVPSQQMPLSGLPTTSEGYSVSHKPNVWFLACGLTSAGVILVALGLGLHSWKQRRNKQVFFDVHAQGPDAPLGQLKKFTLKELQAATDNFDSKNLLGKGGFGHVYKGHLPDGSAIAVKRLKDASIVGGELQFQMEVEMISMAVHRNLLRLWGFCMTPSERLLVYPFMSNGSVASRLHESKPVLDWPTRKRIAVGAARGLLYLHEHCDPKIIHRDVKAANILLDEGFEAVVGDFGLAKLLDHEDTHITTAVRGTVGHIAPEYLSTGQSSDKTDVFGYGILLLELITGERAFDFGRVKHSKDVMLLDWVKTLHLEKKLECLADPRLKTAFNAFELEEMVQVALLCTQYSPLDRPTMSAVVRMLEGDGLAERWEAWQKVELRRIEEARLLPRRYDRLLEDSTFDVEAIELSGPR